MGNGFIPLGVTRWGRFFSYLSYQFYHMTCNTVTGLLNCTSALHRTRIYPSATGNRTTPPYFSQNQLPPRGGGGSPYLRYMRVCHFGGWVLEDFALHKGPFIASKLPYSRVLFCSNLKFHPLKMHASLTSTVKIFESPLNHTFWGHFCPLFLKFALQKGQIFGAYAPYRRVGCQMPKWHTRVQNRGRAPLRGHIQIYSLPSK